MFTGLVKTLGTVVSAEPFGRGRRFVIDLGSVSADAAIGQSVAVNGVCLTVTERAGAAAAFDAVGETVARTNLGFLRAGGRVNLEPALRAGGALDGHMMLGHVDALARVLEMDAKDPDNRVIRVELPRGIAHLVAEKGSVAVDGVSLTVAEAGRNWFTVAVIPHTWANSTLRLRKPGDGVNLEADVLARYAARILGKEPKSGLTEEFLAENGFA
ncbi:MAG: riboflavin synthase [Planctomycetota bacterium]|jgi:riboflavin synthase|nr:riboflavin synthase [Planctomycetota bacterium]